MDFTSGDVAVKHIVKLEHFKIIHLLEISPSVISIFKVLRDCCIALACAWAAVGLSRSIVEYRRTGNKGRPES